MVYGHYGRPVLVFPSEAGRAWDFENNGMVGAVADLIEAGRIKLFCVDSHDRDSWSNQSLPIEDRARTHEAYERWIIEQVVPFIHWHTGGPQDIITHGCSMGAFHALNFALRRADLFPLAMAFSGNYNPTEWHSWGEPGLSTYFNNPTSYIPNLDGGHLDWLRDRLSVLLVVGRGAFEVENTNALPSTEAVAGMLQAKGIRCELDIWGEDTPHDWPSWRRQIAYHMPRFC